MCVLGCARRLCGRSQQAQGGEHVGSQTEAACGRMSLQPLIGRRRLSGQETEGGVTPGAGRRGIFPALESPSVTTVSALLVRPGQTCGMQITVAENGGVYGDLGRHCRVLSQPGGLCRCWWGEACKRRDSSVVKMEK